MPLLVPTVHNRDTLLATLRRIDIAVLLPSEGRDQRKHVEPYVICHLLATLAKANLLTYPLSLNQSEKPDFLIVQSNQSIGIEVTEAVPTGYAHYVAVADKEDHNALLEPGHFRWGSPIRKREELLRLLAQPRLTAPPFYDSQPEQEWAQFLSECINKKLLKLAHPDFKKFDLNWLAIYDNLPLPRVRREEAISDLKSLLPELWTSTPAFDVIFIERGKSIIKVTADGSEWLPLNDVWD